MIQSISHICFSVSDLQKSIKFFSEVLKGKLLVKGRSTAYLDIGGVWIALNEERAIMRQEQNTYTHIAFKIEENEIAEWENRLKSYGVEILEGRPRDKKDKKSIYFKDLDGHKLELHTGTLDDRLSYYQSDKKHMTFYNK